MQNINEIITKNFNDNISYIQANHIELFSKLSALDSAIEEGHYKEKYDLVYENNNFDVLEKATNNYLYNKDSSTHASLASQSIDYNIEDNLFEGFHKHTISDEDLTNYAEEPPFENQMSGFAPIIHYAQRNSSKSKTLNNLDKFIFFGAGLGLHINSIDKKISSKVYFIIEDDLELFRLSLFTINYKKLSQNSTLVFSVFEDNNEFMKSAERFLKIEYYYNHYIKYFHILSHSDEKVKQFQIVIGSQSHLLFFYNSLLTQYLKPLDYIFDDYKFLNNTLHLDCKEFDEKPFLLVAAGPSLENNIAWLKANHRAFSVVALSATLSILEKEEITPDIITHIDAFESAKVHFDKLNSLEFIKDSILIYSSRIPKDVVSIFNKKQLFFIESGTEYKKDSLKPSAPCVGSLTYQLLLRLKAKNIYLLGLDMAIDSKTGKTHSSAHQYTKTLNIDENSNDSTISFKESLLNVAGNFCDSVLTTPNFKISIDSINNATKLLKDKNVKVYNLNDGAKFTDSIPKRADDIKINKTFVHIKDYLFKLCSENSSICLLDVELNVLNNKLKHSKEMQNIIIKYKQSKKSNLDQYMEELKELSRKLSMPQDMKKYELSRVLDTYLKYILEYIFGFFNNNELKPVQEEIENLDSLLISHLLKITEYYYNSLTSQLDGQ